MPRIVAIDFGLKRIGLAISDDRGQIALPLKEVSAGKNFNDSARNVLKALAIYGKELQRIIVGDPLHLSGQPSEMSRYVAQFIAALSIETQIPIETIDERLSSRQAEKSLIELSYNRKKRSRLIDSTSALILLQTYLERSK